MTTATLWEAGDYRTLTEDDIRKLREDAFHNEDITVATQQEALNNFKMIVDSYIQVRSRIDPEWRHMTDTSDDDADWDFLGDTISVEWKERDRCGDLDYFRREFPLEHLWHPDWEFLLTGERNRKIQTEKEAREAAEARHRAGKEAAERQQLRELLAKYGIPEDLAKDRPYSD
jgi:hypothetical protein